MVVIAGAFKFNPDHIDDVAAAMARIVAASRDETGNLAYSFAADVGERGCFRLFEHWESDDALAAHGRTTHVAEFRAATRDHLVSAQVSRYEVLGARTLTRDAH